MPGRTGDAFTMFKLYHYPGTTSMVPHILLEELGEPFELVLVDRTLQEHKASEFTRLNPNGELPVLVENDFVLYETAAICSYLCDRFPESELAPQFGLRERARFNQWLSWLSGNIQPVMMLYFYPWRWVDIDNPVAASQIRLHAERKALVLLEVIEAELARHDAPWLMGTQYSAVDAYLFVISRWTRRFADKSARHFPYLSDFLHRMLQRPAVQRVLQTEQIEPPYI